MIYTVRSPKSYICSSVAHFVVRADKKMSRSGAKSSILQSMLGARSCLRCVRRQQIKCMLGSKQHIVSIDWPSRSCSKITLPNQPPRGMLRCAGGLGAPDWCPNRHCRPLHLPSWNYKAIHPLTLPRHYRALYPPCSSALQSSSSSPLRDCRALQAPPV